MNGDDKPLFPAMVGYDEEVRQAFRDSKELKRYENLLRQLAIDLRPINEVLHALGFTTRCRNEQ